MVTKKAFDKIAEGLNEPPRNACADRVIDTERAGGTGNAAPKSMTPASRPLTVDEAMAYRQSISWRAFMGRSDRAVIALADEVERLRKEVHESWNDMERLYGERDDARAEVERLREQLRQVQDEVETLCVDLDAYYTDRGP